MTNKSFLPSEFGVTADGIKHVSAALVTCARNAPTLDINIKMDKKLFLIKSINKIVIAKKTLKDRNFSN
jgi:hypothetical protein